MDSGNTTSRNRLQADWLAAFITGIVSGTFSTIIVTFGAGRIGRSALMDWMEISTAYFGTGMISAHPTWNAILGGLIVHQTADLAWAMVFFVLLGRWTRALSPSALLLFALPWALLTSVIEYFVILPRLQPLVPMQVPFWTALTVHITSGFAYPVYHYVRSWLSKDYSFNVGFGRAWSLVLVAVSAAFGILFGLAATGNEVSLPIATEGGRESDKKFLRQMKAHHEIGVYMSRLAAERAVEPDLRMLGRLMVASQSAEIDTIDNWWRSWFDGNVPSVSNRERNTMPGMPSQQQLTRLASLEGKPFQGEFIRLMVKHHEGAIMMARETWGSRGDPRTFLMAESIIHAQVGQMERMELYCDCSDYSSRISRKRINLPEPLL